MGRFGKCLASFGPAAAQLLNWTPALNREASQFRDDPGQKGYSRAQARSTTQARRFRDDPDQKNDPGQEV